MLFHIYVIFTYIYSKYNTHIYNENWWKRGNESETKWKEVYEKAGKKKDV